MPSSTPALDIPYATDDDPRALYPTTDYQKATRLEELLASYYAQASNLAGSTGPAGATIPLTLSLEPDAPFVLDGGSVIRYTGPDRRFHITVQATMGAGEPLKSTVVLSSAPANPIRASVMSTGVGPDGQATHTHSVSFTGTLTTGATFCVDAGAETASSGAVAVDVQVYAVTL